MSRSTACGCAPVWIQGQQRSKRRPHGALLVKAQAASVPADSNSSSATPSSRGVSQPVVWTVGAAAVLAVAAAFVWTQGYAPVLQDWVKQSALSKSGVLPAFSLIFLSEIGDKTFFIAALLAAKVGKWVSFTGAVAALAIMTAISVGIGCAFNAVPEALRGTLPIGEYLGVALLVYFGLRTLRDAHQMPAVQSEDDDSDELGAAQKSVDEATINSTNTWQSLVEVGTLIFVAEWGDRSMLATIALGAAQSPLGVAAGAIAGHAAATLIAVFGGALAAKHVSERTLNYISGVLFLVFAAATIFGLF